MSLRQLSTLIKRQVPSLIEIRHDLHAHPQLGFQETYASETIQRELRKIGLPFEAGVAKTGIVAWVTPQDPKRAKLDAVGLRADMDALPIQEESNLPYASQYPGFMHACGHDGHTTVLLGAARVLAQMRDQLPRPVKLLFQPAEEGFGGAPKMMEDGALEARVGGRKVAMIFGLHGDPSQAVGRYSTRPGAFMAAVDEVSIIVNGQGGHAAMPHRTADPVVAAAQIITALQTVVARNVNPIRSVVVTIAAVHGGQAFNVIPDTVRLSGTVRTFETETRDLVHRRIREITRCTAKALGCRAKVSFPGFYYPPVLNDSAATDYATKMAQRALGAKNANGRADPIMGGEDFAFYGSRVPGCFGFIGVRPPDRDTYPGLHTSRYDFTDAAIEVGVKLMSQWALNADEIH